MKIYIASKYIDHKDINREIFVRLTQAGIEAFLPETIDINAITIEEMHYVAETCYNEIDKCAIILVVCPIGPSVSSEIGYAISQKRINKDSKKIILFKTDPCDSVPEKEAMIAPYIDATIENIDQLINCLSYMD